MTIVLASLVALALVDIALISAAIRFERHVHTLPHFDERPAHVDFVPEPLEATAAN